MDTNQTDSFFGSTQVKQQNLQADAVKQRHVDGLITISGLAADRPDGTTDVNQYFSTDTGVLSIWNGTAWDNFSSTSTPTTVQFVTSTTDLNTTSAAYIDYTGLTVSFTPSVTSNLLMIFNTSSYTSANNSTVRFVANLDGSITGHDPLTAFEEPGGAAAGNVQYSVSGTLWITGVSATAHTLKIQAQIVVAGTLHTKYGSLLVIPFNA